MARRSSMPCVWSACSCVNSTASTRVMPAPSSWSRSSGGVSMRITAPPSVSTTAPTRDRLSRGSVERQTAQSHPSCGTPKLVPVPRKVSFTARVPPPGATSYRLDLHEVRGTWHVERDPRRDDDAIAFAREPTRADGVERELHHVRVGVTVRNQAGDHAPHQRELPVGAFLVGEHEDRHTGAVRGDDARREAALGEHDQTRRAEAARSSLRHTGGCFSISWMIRAIASTARRGY